MKQDAVHPTMKSLSFTEMRLLALIVDKELTGREIAQRYKSLNKRTISYGTLYTTLRRMRELGWVSVSEDQDEDGRIRKFGITGLGRKALTTGREDFLRIFPQDL